MKLRGVGLFGALIAVAKGNQLSERCPVPDSQYSFLNPQNQLPFKLSPDNNYMFFNQYFLVGLQDRAIRLSLLADFEWVLDSELNDLLLQPDVHGESAIHRLLMLISKLNIQEIRELEPILDRLDPHLFVNEIYQQSASISCLWILLDMQLFTVPAIRTIWQRLGALIPTNLELLFLNRNDYGETLLRSLLYMINRQPVDQLHEVRSLLQHFYLRMFYLASLKEDYRYSAMFELLNLLDTDSLLMEDGINILLNFHNLRPDELSKSMIHLNAHNESVLRNLMVQASRLPHPQLIELGPLFNRLQLNMFIQESQQENRPFSAFDDLLILLNMYPDMLPKVITIFIGLLELQSSSLDRLLMQPNTSRESSVQNLLNLIYSNDIFIQYPGLSRSKLLAKLPNKENMLWLGTDLIISLFYTVKLLILFLFGFYSLKCIAEKLIKYKTDHLKNGALTLLSDLRDYNIRKKRNSRQERALERLSNLEERHGSRNNNSDNLSPGETNMDDVIIKNIIKEMQLELEGQVTGFKKLLDGKLSESKFKNIILNIPLTDSLFSVIFEMRKKLNSQLLSSAKKISNQAKTEASDFIQKLEFVFLEKLKTKEDLSEDLFEYIHKIVSPFDSKNPDLFVKKVKNEIERRENHNQGQIRQMAGR